MHIAFCEDYKMQIYSHRTPMNSWNIVGKTTEKKKTSLKESISTSQWTNAKKINK